MPYKTPQEFTSQNSSRLADHSAIRPYYTLHYFLTSDDARKYRHDNGTGGWIFKPEMGPSILFPPDWTPSTIFNHSAVAGKHGRMIGSQ